ncbi:hypothetical protein WA158_000489 [Blastocystis sp. Blastoise]
MNSEVIYDISPEDVNKFSCNAVFSSPSNVVTADYHIHGKFAAIGYDDSTISMVNTCNGRLVKTILCSKYGFSHLCYSNSESCILCSSSKTNENQLLYLSLYDNTYIHSFTHHRNPITSIAVSPISDIVITADKDGYLYQWDLRSKNCQYIIRMPQYNHKPLSATLSHTGISLGVSAESDFIHLYDIRNLKEGFYESFDINCGQNIISNIHYSVDDTRLLVEMNAPSLPSTTAKNIPHKTAIIDSILGSMIFEIEGISNPALSPDANYLAGVQNNVYINIWKIPSNPNRTITTLKMHTNPINHLLWNPIYSQLLSTDKNSYLWNISV